MLFYAELSAPKAEAAEFYLQIDAPSFASAVAETTAWCYGFSTGTGLPINIISIVAGSKPRGKTYFKFSDADAIRRGLKI